jgi:hypothetical protein
MKGYLYYIVLLFQLMALFNNVFVFFHPAYTQYFWISVACFLASIATLLLAMYKTQRGNFSSCITTILVLLNIFFYAMYLFTSYLTTFVHSMQK